MGRILAKRTDLTLSNEYLKQLNEACNDKNVRNVGVFGTYGSGKSSIVGSYLERKNKLKNTVFFSIDTFNKHSKKAVADSKDTEKEPLENFIDIRKTFYEELLNYDNYLFDLSGYRKSISMIKRNRWMFILAILFCLFGSMALGHFLYQFLGFASLLVALCSLFAASILPIFLYGKKVDSMQINVSNSISLSISTSDDSKKEIDLTKMNAIENLVIDILSGRHIQYVVIEDVERFCKGNTKHIVSFINEFRLLNELINRSQKYRKCPIRFIYGLKDGCFEDSEERTKNFDFIITILPFAAHSNAKAAIFSDSLINKSFKEDEQTIIGIVSSYFKNQREVNAFLTEFEIMKNKHIDSFDNLKNEIVSLAALNVLFPRAYNSLYEKNNFLKQIFDKDFKDEELLNSVATIVRDCKCSIDKTNCVNICANGNEVNELSMFIVSCIRVGALTLNYERIIVENRGTFLTEEDISVEQKFMAGIDITGNEIFDPVCFIQDLGSEATKLFSKPKFANPDIAHAVKIIDKSEYIKLFNKQINSLTTQQLIVFLNHFLTKYRDDSDITFIVDHLCNNEKIYSAIPKINAQKEKTSLILFNNLKIESFKKADKDITSFKDIITSDEFLKEYALDLDLPIFEQVIREKMIVFKNIVYLRDQEKYLNVFRKNGGYVINYDNVSLLFPDFNKAPSKTILNNLYLKSTIFANGDTLKELLDKCDQKSEGDDDFIFNFCIEIIAKNLHQLVFTSPYFEQWKLKLPYLATATTSTYVELLRYGFLNLADKELCDKKFVPNYPTAFLESLNKNAKMVDSNCVFSESTSWFIVKSLTDEELSNIINSLTLTNPAAYYPRYEKSIFKAIKFAKGENKILVAKECLENAEDLFYENLTNETITVEEAKEIKMTETILAKGISDKKLSITNVFARGINTEVAISYLSKNKEGNGWMLFFDSEHNCIGTDSEKLALTYCNNYKTENFDNISSFINSLDADLFSNKKEWIDFLKSFADENKDNSYYFANYDNNHIILEKLNKENIVSSYIYVKGRNQLKVKFH